MSNDGEARSATLDFQWGDEVMEFECFDDARSRLTCETVLGGWAYPVVPFVRDVNVVMDVGANVGAAAVFFSLAYPAATVHAFEPARRPYRLLKANTDSRPNVHAHNFGLYSTNLRTRLDNGTEASEPITLRSVREWLAENSIPTVDVLKIDAAACEVPILEAMSDLLPTIKVVHLEYHSDDDRKAFDRLLGETHLLLHGKMQAHLGEVTYVGRNAFESEAQLDRRPMKLEL